MCTKYYNKIDLHSNTNTNTNIRQHTRRPIVTGTSVLGLKYNGGVMVASDTLLSYGSMAKTQDASRITVINQQQHGSSNNNCGNTILAASGEYSDFQAIEKLLNQKASQEASSLMDDLYADGETQRSNAESTWNYLRMVMYQRRNKMNPYWNDVIVAGRGSNNSKDGSATVFLGLVDKIGTTYTDNYIATGFGSYLALPILREHWRSDLTEGEARALLEDCLKVLFFRDCRASSKIQLAKYSVADNTAMVSEPYQLDNIATGDWDAPSFVSPVAELEGDGGW